MSSFAEMNVVKDNSFSRPSATQLFTDREEPQEAFERKIQALTPYRKTASGVLMYYGIGGVGKTWLKNRFCHLLNGDLDIPRKRAGTLDAYYATFDFDEPGISYDKRTILLRIRNQLVQKNKHFKFFLFDTALIVYAKKVGVELREDESSSLILSQNPWLNSIITGLGAIPVVGWASNILQGLDQFGGAIKNKLSDHVQKKAYEDTLNKMCQKEPDEILSVIHQYFIEDMRDNMLQVADKPLVIFLDTYEKYVDLLKSDTLKLIDDYWLRKDYDCVIKSIPGVMWVIFGKNKLLWNEDDPYWECGIPERPLDELSEEEKCVLAMEKLEQHLLGDLSVEDTIVYLSKNDIRDIDLGKQLHKLTNGTPLFLDMCVRQYYVLKDKHSATIDDFGKDLTELINRYFLSMPSHYRNMTYLFAVLGQWNDEIAKSIAPRTLLADSFSERRYADYLTNSFIISNGDGTYYIHETVKTAVLSQIDSNIRNSVNDAIEKYCQEKLDKESKNNKEEFAAKYLEIIKRRELTYDEIYYRWQQIYPTISKLLAENKNKDFLNMISGFRSLIVPTFSDTELGDLVSTMYAYGLEKTGKWSDKDNIEKILDTPVLNYKGEISKQDYIRLLMTRSLAYSWLNKMKAGEDYAEKAISFALKEDDEDLLRCSEVLERYSEIYRYLNKMEEMLMLRERVLNQVGPLKEVCNPDSLQASYNVVGSLASLGKMHEAEDVIKRIILESQKLYGCEHSFTVKCLNLYADINSGMGNIQKALEIRKQAYDITASQLRDDTQESVLQLMKIASDYEMMGDCVKALETYNKCFEFFSRELGENMPETLTVLSKIGTCYNELGNLEKALECFQNVYEARKQIIGEEHPDTLQSLYLN